MLNYDICTKMYMNIYGSSYNATAYDFRIQWHKSIRLVILNR